MQEATLPDTGKDTPLVALVRQLGLPAELIDKVQQSGCETPADWKYAILEEPIDTHEKSPSTRTHANDSLSYGSSRDIGSDMLLATFSWSLVLVRLRAH